MRSDIVTEGCNRRETVNLYRWSKISERCYDIIDVLIRSSVCQKLTKENADTGWLQLLRAALQTVVLLLLPPMLFITLLAVTSAELSTVPSVSLIHSDPPLVTSSIPRKSDSLLMWGVSPCSSAGGEEQPFVFTSDNLSTGPAPAVPSAFDCLRSRPCWVGQNSTHSPSFRQSGEHLWSNARAAKADGSFCCWAADSADVEGWLAVFCWLLLPRWQPGIRALHCRRIYRQVWSLLDTSTWSISDSRPPPRDI